MGTKQIGEIGQNRSNQPAIVSFCCAQTAAEFYVVDARTHALRHTVPIEGADGSRKQMRRVRVSPDNRHVVVSSNQDHHVAIFLADGLEQTASIPVKKGPMGFGFAPDGLPYPLRPASERVIYEPPTPIHGRVRIVFERDGQVDRYAATNVLLERDGTFHRQQVEILLGHMLNVLESDGVIR